MITSMLLCAASLAALLLVAVLAPNRMHDVVWLWPTAAASFGAAAVTARFIC